MKIAILALVLLSAVPAAWAAPEYKGVSYTSFNASALSSSGSDQSLLNMSMLGTDTVALNFWWYQPSIDSSGIAPTGSSATIAAIEHAIDTIHGLGMKVLLKPMLDVNDASNSWRALIDPSDPDEWFTNYRSYINTFADIAEAKGVELFSIGCEFNNLENPVNNQRWIDTIADTRTHYSGPLTYSANWNNGGIGGGYDAIQWWDQLDKIGIDAYFPIATSANASATALANGWNTAADTIDAWRLANFPDKRVLFTEVGYSSYDGSTVTPYASASGQLPDEAEQAAAYEALLSVMTERDWWDGAFWWNWETNPNPTSATSFTPQYKLAQEVLASYYGGPGTPLPFTAWANNAGGDFGSAGNWTGGVPNAVFSVEFDRGAGTNLTVTSGNNRTVQRLRIRSGIVTFDSSSATRRSLTADDGHMDDANRAMIVGVDDGDVATLNAGAAMSSLSARALTIGDANGATGTVNLNNSANRLNITGFDSTQFELIVGRAGHGTLNVSNGADVFVNTATSTNAVVGRDAGGVGIVNLSGVGTTFVTNTSLRIGQQGQGFLNVSNGAAVTATTLLIGTTGEVHFDGSLTGGISNSGVLNLGDSVGMLTVSTNYNQFSTGQLIIQLASTTSFDKLKIAGTANLGGLLSIVLVDDFSPALGDTFDILDFAFRFGTFAAFDLPPIAANLAWDTSQLATSGIVSIVADLPGDFNSDHVVDAADYTVWRNGLGSIYTDTDYDVWKAHFGQSSGSGSTAEASLAHAAVPEPTSAIATLFAVIAVVAGARLPNKPR